MYTPKPEDLARLVRNFTYNTPFGSQAERYGTIRRMAHEFAHGLLTLCPPSRELSLALTQIEDAVYWANAAIARNEEQPPTA